MTNLDLMLILLCIAGIALIIYLIYTLSKLTKTIDKINDLVDENAKGITNIVNNVDSATEDVTLLTGKASNIVQGVESGLKKPVTADNVSDIVFSAKNIFDISTNAVRAAGIASTIFGYFKMRSEKRKRKKQEQEDRKKERQLKREMRRCKK